MAARPLVLLTALLLVACSGGREGAGDDGASLGEPAEPIPVTAPEVPAASPAGTGVVVISGGPSSFAVTECRLDLQPGEDGTSDLLLVRGEGTNRSGVAFEVEVRRSAADSAASETFTDSASYSDTARILQLQRIEVDGEVTDLRDPSARATLLEVRPDGVALAGIAGPPGSIAGEEGMVDFALDATCD